MQKCYNIGWILECVSIYKRYLDLFFTKNPSFGGWRGENPVLKPLHTVELLPKAKKPPFVWAVPPINSNIRRSTHQEPSSD